MRYLLRLFGIWAVLSMPTHAEPSAIKQVIGDQIAAFQSDDFTAAFDFASPTIKQLFGSSERFGQMVRNGYPMVHRPKSMEFQELNQRNGRFYQELLIEDQSGRFFIAEYEMIEMDEGVWKINGVRILEAPLVGA